ncbi:MAG: RIP metalloprotease [Hyphomonadaceae bacterium]|nr:RIP metalloprotease [Hyphomonadaceae bacterium]
MSFLLSAILFIVSFLVVISFLVFFHELGHYSVARMFNTVVERFSIGFGKPIMKWTAKSGTEWTISRWPLGGYVKFLGDAGAASHPDMEKLEAIRANVEACYGDNALGNCFHFKPLWQRTLIVLAGPMANFILAILIFAIIALVMGHQELKSVVTAVRPDGAAAEAGVRIGDHFLKMNGADVSESDDLTAYVALRSGVELNTEIDRGGDVITLTITPKREERRDFLGGVNQIGTIGVQIGGEGNVVEYNHTLLSALGHGVERCYRTIALTGTYIKRIFQGREDGSALGGPTRIATMTGKTAVDVANMDIPLGEKISAGFWMLLSLSAVLSVGLGVANLMPIPALDGGHLLYYGYEALAGRPLSGDKQEFGFRIGFACLIALLVYLTINDIGYVRSLFS